MRQTQLLLTGRIERNIFLIRRQKVMLDVNLAELYRVETKTLKRAVRRNQERFPKDFMFELTGQEYTALRYHFGTLKRGEHTKYLPYAFTKQGVAMLSSVLRSSRAVQVNIEIMSRRDGFAKGICKIERNSCATQIPCPQTSGT
jgi:hypothetical protein